MPSNALDDQRLTRRINLVSLSNALKSVFKNSKYCTYKNKHYFVSKYSSLVLSV